MDTTRVHVPLGLFTLSAYGRPLLDIGIPESAPPLHTFLTTCYQRPFSDRWSTTLRLQVPKLYSGTRLP